MNATGVSTQVVKRDQSHSGRPLQVFDDVIHVKLAGRLTGGQYSVVEDISAPRTGPPLHMHTREDESFYVVEGEYLFEIDGERIVAKAGDFLFAARGTRHCFMNTGDTNARMLVMAQPGGIDEFFEDLAQVQGSPAPEAVMPIFAKYGLELLGPPMAHRQGA